MNTLWTEWGILKMADSRAQDIFQYLKARDIEVYFPAQHKGECLSNYVVVRTSTSTQFADYSSTITYYDLMCYVPKARYGDLDTFTEAVKDAMKGLVPMIKPTYTETPGFYDESVKGYMRSIQYRNYRQIVI